jgi:Fe2+ or Zn2+ uptake regulation protein
MMPKKNDAGRGRPRERARAGEALRATGLRLTRPRRVILEVVKASDAHPSVALVHARVREFLPRVSLGTVYRNLRRLAAEGLVQERAEAGGFRFDGNTTPHDHFTCVACGRVVDLPRPRPGRPPRAAGRDLEILSHRIEFYGRCGACRRRGLSSTVTRPRRHHQHGQ